LPGHKSINTGNPEGLFFKIFSSAMIYSYPFHNFYHQYDIVLNIACQLSSASNLNIIQANALTEPACFYTLNSYGLI
jgi:hypothetical protein